MKNTLKTDELNDAIRAQVNLEIPKPPGGFETDDQELQFRQQQESRFVSLVENYGKFVLRRKSDGWMVAPGSKHTSTPDNAILIDAAELGEWINAWGSDYEVVEFQKAREVE